MPAMAMHGSPTFTSPASAAISAISTYDLHPLAEDAQRLCHKLVNLVGAPLLAHGAADSAEGMLTGEDLRTGGLDGSAVLLPAINIQRPKSLSNGDAGALQIRDRLDNLVVTHIFGRIVVLVHY